MHNKRKLIIGFSLLFPAIVFAEGQRGLEEFVWTIGLSFIIGLILIIAVAGYFIINNIGQNKLNKKQKHMYWLATLLVACFVWVALNFAKNNNEDYLEKEDAKQKAINDSIIKAIQHKDSLTKIASM